MKVDVRTGNTWQFIYDDEEIRRGWESGQGNQQARERGKFCVIAPLPDVEFAVGLTHLFVMLVFAIPSCTHWDNETLTLSMYCGDAGGNYRECQKRAVQVTTAYMLAVDAMSPEQAAAWAHGECARLGLNTKEA